VIEFPKSERLAQKEKILALLKKYEGEWVPLPSILALGVAQYNTRILELRREGFKIANRTEREGMRRISWFGLNVPEQVP
jgi:hypothetical protein